MKVSSMGEGRGGREGGRQNDILKNDSGGFDMLQNDCFFCVMLQNASGGFDMLQNDCFFGVMLQNASGGFDMLQNDSGVLICYRMTLGF